MIIEDLALTIKVLTMIDLAPAFVVGAFGCIKFGFVFILGAYHHFNVLPTNCYRHPFLPG